MDTYDVSSLDYYLQLLNKQNKNLKAAKARQGERPEDRMSQQDLVNSFEMHLAVQQIHEWTTAPSERMMHSSFLPPPYLPSIAPLGELKQTFINDLRLETHHRGKYLLLRSITPPNRMTAIMVIVEDERKDALRRARATLITRLRLELGGVILVGDVLAASTRTHQPTSIAMPVQHTTVLTTPPRNSGSILGSS
jgi:hypothetical protein